MTVIGGDRSIISIECNGQDSCKNAVIDAADADEMIMSGCEASGSCIGVTLFCPENVDGMEKCTVIGMYVI